MTRKQNPALERCRELNKRLAQLGSAIEHYVAKRMECNCEEGWTKSPVTGHTEHCRINKEVTRLIDEVFK